MDKQPDRLCARVDETAWRARLMAARRRKDDFFRHDDASPLPPGRRAGFAGLRYFDPDPAYATQAVLRREPKQGLDIPRTGGDHVHYARLGTFELLLPVGRVRLAAYDGGHGSLWLPFRDQTSGHTTYGAGRYLDIRLGPGGAAAVDLNQAYHPFCAYDEAFTCPLPPAENWLTVAIEVGERL